MQTIGSVLKENQVINGGILAQSSKPYWDMTTEEKREYHLKRCKMFDLEEGKLNERDGHNCPDCRNRGYIHVVKEQERGNQIAFYEMIRDCHCKPIRASIMKMKRSGLENVMQKYTFARYNAVEPWQKHIKDKAQNFVKNGGSVFYIGGQTGAGKSHICTAITVEFLRQGKAAYYMLWQDETVEIKSCVMESTEYHQRMQKLKEIEVLYIDDFFKPVGDQKAPSSADIRLAYELINYRYNNSGLITIISSERLIGEILDIDEATGGRLVEYAGEYMINIGRDKNRNYRLRNTGLI